MKKNIKCLNETHTLHIFGSDKSLRSADVRSFGLSLSRAVNLHLSRSERIIPSHFLELSPEIWALYDEMQDELNATTYGL